MHGIQINLPNNVQKVFFILWKSRSPEVNGDVKLSGSANNAGGGFQSLLYFLLKGSITYMKKHFI